MSNMNQKKKKKNALFARATNRNPWIYCCPGYRSVRSGRPERLVSTIAPGQQFAQHLLVAPVAEKIDVHMPERQAGPGLALQRDGRAAPRA